VELFLVVGLYQGYRMVRGLTRDEVGAAVRNAEHVVRLEHLLGLPDERAVQRLAMLEQPVIEALNRYYVYGHFVPMVVLLIWLYVRRPTFYPRFRTVVAAVTLAGLVLHVAYPLAPPRMMPGFVDTVARFGPAVYSSGPTASAANQIAAMPSLHFGWAVLVAWAIVLAGRHPLRWVVAAHPFLMLTTIVATANHWWLDAAVAGLLVGGAVLLERAARVGQHRPPAWAPVGAGVGTLDGVALQATPVPLYQRRPARAGTSPVPPTGRAATAMPRAHTRSTSARYPSRSPAS